jgi:hypothetical protein
MKLFPLVAARAFGLLLAAGFFGIGCADDPAPDAAPAPVEVKHVTSSLERKLPAPVAVPGDTAIGLGIDALVALDTTSVARDPVLRLDANGKSCTIVRYDDAKGAEAMRRETCAGSTDTLFLGKVVYVDHDLDGKIDHVSDLSAGTYEVFDDDGDGRLDRMVEGAERVKAPIELTDFAPNVTIMGNGTIATRERKDLDHDGKFDVESVTATTSFEITTVVVAAVPPVSP